MKLLWCLLVGAAMCAWSDSQTRLRFDFETGDLQGWQVMEGRFGAIVSDRALCRNTPNTPYPKEGRYFLSTTELSDGGFDDGMTGVVESPAIRLTGPVITLQVGGGGHPETYVALCTEDGVERRVARGANSETMQRVRWDVSELVGKIVYFVVVDQHKGSWGHITLDAVEVDGVLDAEATARLRGNYTERKERRMRMQQAEEAARAAQRERHRRQLQDPKYLFDQGKPRVYSGEALQAISMPVGGIGAGCIQMDGYGRPAIWQIFGNYRAMRIPDSLLAIRCKVGASAPAVRALQGAAAGPFAGMRTVRFQGEYPFGWWRLEDPALPLDVTLEVFSPLVPGNARDSAFPAAVFRVTVRNRSSKQAHVHLLAVQQNALGLDPNHEPEGLQAPSYGGNHNRVISQPGLSVVAMSREDSPGTMALAAVGRTVAAAADCGDLDAVCKAFTETGQVGGPAETPPSPQGRTFDAAMSVPMHLRPNESRTQAFFLTWHMPGQVHGEGAWQAKGCMYENWWPDAPAVAVELKRRLPELLARTRLYHDTLYASNLPRWLLDRISSQVAILRSKTCFWGKDGYFGAWEGCNAGQGCCMGNCSHVWHYAQAHARLWPELGRRMREQELRQTTAEGAVPHRQPDAFPAFDGQCGTILGAYREHLCSADDAWLREHWPTIRRAMDYLVRTHDPDEDGMLTGPQWNTLDERAGGTSSWLGSLYIAALRACERMALRMQDPGAERYARIAEAASPNQDRALFSGEYYIQVPEATPYRDYGNGCHIDQVLGQWWADMLDLGRIYPADRCRSALAALHRHNFLYDFVGVRQAPRKFVHDDDAGTKMITWPRGGRPPAEHEMAYADEVMTGFEYAAAAAMVYHGLIEEGFRTARAIADRYDGRLRTGLSAGDYTAWGYSGNPFGDDECGKFYGRAMSSWSLLLACQGFVYDGPAGLIGFLPRWRPEDHVSFFTAAEGWGLFAQKRTSAGLRASLKIAYGRLRLRTIVLVPSSGKVTAVRVTVAGKAVPCSAKLVDNTVHITLRRAFFLTAGPKVEVIVR